MVTTTFCMSGAAIIKAGVKNVSTALPSVGTDYSVDLWITQAESLINVMTRYNWTDVYTATLNDDVKKILEGVASDLAAIQIILYDMSAYTSRIEAEDMINVLRDNALRGLAILRDKKNQSFLRDPATGSV